MLGNLIGGFITILVGITIFPEVANLVAAARYNNVSSGAQNDNLTGAAFTVTGLVTLFFALGVMSVGVGVAAEGLRAAGLLGM